MKSFVAICRTVRAATFVVSALVAVVSGDGRAAWAQEAAAQVQPGAPTPLAARAQDGTYGAPRAGATTTTVRAEARRAMMEKRMRELMTRSGIAVPATQDAILTFLREDENDKKLVREAGRRLWNGVQRDVPAERLRSLLSDYQKAIQSARERRLRAQTALDARVGYSLDAHLESLLWLLGVLGEGQNILVLPAPPQPRGPRTNIRIAIPALTAPNERQIEGTVSALSAPNETPVWLEIRDGAGHLWRMLPSDEPDARAILNRQIAQLAPGNRVAVRVASTGQEKDENPLSLLTIVPANAKEDTYGEGNEGGDEAKPLAGEQ